MSSYRGNSSPPPPSLQPNQKISHSLMKYISDDIADMGCVSFRRQLCAVVGGAVYIQDVRGTTHGHPWWRWCLHVPDRTNPEPLWLPPTAQSTSSPPPPPPNQLITPIVIDYVWNDGSRRGYGRDHRPIAAEVLVCEKGRTWAGRLSRYPIRVMPSLPYSVSTFLYLVLPPLSFSSSKWSYFISVTRPQLQQIFVTLQFAKPEDPLFEQSFINVMTFCSNFY